MFWLFRQLRLAFLSITLFSLERWCEWLAIQTKKRHNCTLPLCTLYPLFRLNFPLPYITHNFHSLLLERSSKCFELISIKIRCCGTCLMHSQLYIKFKVQKFPNPKEIVNMLCVPIISFYSSNEHWRSYNIISSFTYLFIYLFSFGSQTDESNYMWTQNYIDKSHVLSAQLIGKKKWKKLFNWL